MNPEDLNLRQLINIITKFGIQLSCIIIDTKYKQKYGANGHVINDPCVGRETSTSQLLPSSFTDVQLSRLRNGHNIVTEYNPNYEFGGSTCTLQDLKEIPRDKLFLIKYVINN